MPSKSTSASQTRRKHILIQMSQLASQIKELQDTYQQVHLQLKHLRMVAGQSQRPHKKRTRKHIHLIVQQIRTKLAQEQGMLSLQMSKRLRKKMKMLKQVAHKTPQSWKSFKYVIRRLDLAMSGLLPIELALSPAPRQSDKPRASTDASLGHYRVPSPVDRASLRSSLPLSIGVLKEATPKIRSVETSLTTLKEEPRRSQTKEKSYNHRRSRKRKSSPRPRARPKMAEVKTDSEVPQDITVKAKLESSRTPGRIQKDFKKKSVSKGTKKHTSKKGSAITAKQISQLSISDTESFRKNMKIPKIRTIQVEPEPAKTNTSVAFYIDPCAQSSYNASSSYNSNVSEASAIDSYISSIGSVQYSSTGYRKPFNLNSRFRYTDPLIGETKTGSKESLHKPLDIMACIRSAITISMTSFISKVSVNSEVDDDLLEEDNLREDRIKKESHQRQKRPQHSPSLTYHSNIEIDTTVPEPVHEQLELNVAELREGWERYFAELEKSPMELLLEQRRNEKAALEVQRQEAQLKEAERQRRLLERQTKPWRRRRTKKMVQDDVPTSGLVPQSEKAHQEVCPECGMSFCYSEHNERPIIVTKGMINKFKYLRAG
ncbi:uncharacterized protein LOC6587264 [Drosophila persimilis]|uniref:uncharacterized protein LOC6587264 n=1 Tax=Drosophila persimilis TaxID=7234 RepID=UPI000F07BAF8|nr:uncharacterized protein LOC6587264 [Drosophila persimilis]